MSQLLEQKIKYASLREAYGETLIELGKENPNIIVMDADLAFSTKTHMFKDVFPDRFFDLGLSEADMMGTAAGLASCGKIVFVSTFAVFATGRPWDQIRLSIAYQKLNVKIVASHGGVATGEDGYSHHAIEDIGLMRLLPQMKVIVPCDANQTRAVVKEAVKIPGPVYIRLVKPPLPIIYENNNKFELGKATILKEGDDITIGAIGPMVYEAIEAHNILKKEKIYARVIDFASVKPIDEDIIKNACDETKAIITCEDHSVIGGLGDAVASVILAYKPIPHIRIGIQDVFTESGSKEDLYKKYGLSAKHIVEKIKWLNL